MGDISRYTLVSFVKNKRIPLQSGTQKRKQLNKKIMTHKTISEVTPILPYLLADRITNDEEMQKYLCERAERHFKANKMFHKGVCGNGNKGRDYLLMFMDHWNNGILKNPLLKV